MEIAAAQEFARRWAEAWNAHDLDAVLSHFSEDAEFSSPVAAQLLPETGGVLRGKEAIRAYWSVGLERIPDLHFEVVDVYTGLNLVVINYRNHVGGLVNEVLRLNDRGLVASGAGTYLVADAAAASGARSESGER
ncbi:nuclear transport factor 2 family protein [Arthrobacter sp. NPDC090010]|uniref:nuclear transport factor 2 family protein n=1 Tax=Arthrobacter sp. NPDC090010 TaxID=3363942 RepID=UPI003808A063